MPETDITDRRDAITGDRDHVGLKDTFASRRYFAKFRTITTHLTRVAAQMRAEGDLSDTEVKILTRYVAALGYTFRALSMKYLMAGRDTGRFFGVLEMDRVESGFPVFNELLVMANDAAQAAKHLENMADTETLKDEMLRKILGEREIPTKLQFALSQRLYYEELLRGDPVLGAQRSRRRSGLAMRGERRRRYLLHWAVYDSMVNLPTIYLMEVEDSGRTAPAQGRGGAGPRRRRI